MLLTQVSTIFTMGATCTLWFVTLGDTVPVSQRLREEKACPPPPPPPPPALDSRRAAV